MRGRRAAKKELDDRPFNYPGKGESKQAKLKKLWLGEVVESDEGWCSGGTIRSNSDLFPRDNSRVSEASLSSGVGEEEGVASIKKDVKHVTASNGFEPVVKIETEGIRTQRNSWGNSDKVTNGGGDEKILEESPRCSLSPSPPNPNNPGEVSTYISYYLRRNLAHGKKSTVLPSLSVGAFFVSRENSQISLEKG